MSGQAIEVALAGIVILMPLIFIRRNLAFVVFLPLTLLFILFHLTGYDIFYNCTDFCLFKYIIYFIAYAVSVVIALIYKTYKRASFQKLEVQDQKATTEKPTALIKIEKIVLISVIAVALLDFLFAGLVGLLNGFFYAHASYLGVPTDMFLIFVSGLYFFLRGGSLLKKQGNEAN